MASSTRKSSRESQAAVLDGANGHGAADSFSLQPLSMGLNASQQFMSFVVRAQQAQFDAIKHLTDSLAQAIEEAREAREPAKVFAIQTQLAVDQMTYLLHASAKLFSQTSSAFAEAASPALPPAGDEAGAAQTTVSPLDGTPLAMMQTLPEAWLDWVKQWNATMASAGRAP